MDLVENNSENESFKGIRIPSFQENDFNPEMKNTLALLFEKFRFLSKKVVDNYKELAGSEFSDYRKNSINQVKEIFEEINKFSENENKESENRFETIFEFIEVFLAKFENLAVKNSSILRDAFQKYILELSVIVEDQFAFLSSVDKKIIPDQNISNTENENRTNSNHADLLEKSESSDINQLILNRILKEEFPQIFKDCLECFIKDLDLYYYQKFDKLRRLIKFSVNCIPAKESEPIIRMNPCRLQPDQISEISLLLNDLIDFPGSRFENYLLELNQNFNIKIEDSLIKQFAQINSIELNPNIHNDSIPFEIYNTHLTQISDKSSLIYHSFFSEIKLENQVERARIKLFHLMQTIYFQVESIIKTNLFLKNEKLIQDIQSATNDYKLKKSPEIENLFHTNHKLMVPVYSEFENIIETSNIAIQELLTTIPETFFVIKELNFNDLKYNTIDDSQKLKIRSKKITESISIDFLAFIQSIIPSLSNKMNEIENGIINQNRLIKYSIFSQDYQQNINFIINSEIDIPQFLDNQLIESQQTKNEIANISNSILSDFSNAFYKANEKLQLSYYANEATNWGQYLPKTKAIKGLSWIKKTYNTMNKYFDVLINKFWSHQSDAQILVDDLWGKKAIDSSVNRFLNKTEYLTLSEKLTAELPFFYKHFFTDRNYFNNEFWRGRNKELDRALIAYKRFQSGIGGSLMIAGERFSGKSFMTRYVCSEILEPHKTIIIDGPEFGTVDIKFLLKKVQEQCGIKGDFFKIFSSLEPNTIVVFEDLELWWEKSENGNQVIQQIFDILDQFSQNVFFIVTINSDSLKIIEKMIKFQSSFLDILHCKPLNSNTLKEITLFRHQASGLKFKFINGISLNGKKTEESFKSKNFSNLFSKYFNYSNGNIGVCLLTWMSNIRKFEDNRIYMQLPQSPEIPEFENLEKDDILLLYQLLIHKKMDLAKMSRVLIQPESVLQKQLDFFKRVGIVVLQNSGYEISPYVNHIVKTYFVKEEML